MITMLVGDCRTRLRELPAESVQTCVTSPPYFGLRDYGVAGQIGLEPTPAEFIETIVEVFREVRRVLREDGTLWLNLGDSITRKQLQGIPWRVAFALQADGWWLRSSIIWAKPNPMPESVTDRPTSAHENIFLLARSERYFYDAAAVREARTSDEDANGFRGGSYVGGKTDNETLGKRSAVGNKRVRHKQRGHGRRHEGFNDRWDAMSKGEQQALGRNLRNVWTVATQPFSGAHFATFPPDLVEPCIKAGSRPGDTVLDPFGGAGTTGLVADRLGRDAVLIELNPDYAAMARHRIEQDAGLFASVAAQ